MALFGGHGNYTNPSDEAMPYLNQIPGTITPYFNPAINLGKGAARTSAPVYHKMITDPEGYYNDIMSNYSASPAEQYKQQQLLAQEAGTAAAGGFSGTPYDQAQQATLTNNLLSQDQQQYFKNITGVQSQGLNASTHAFDTGYEASKTLSQLLAENLAAQAGLAYKGAAFDNQLEAQRRNNRWKTGGIATGAILGTI